jgi:hypothetical protein
VETEDREGQHGGGEYGGGTAWPRPRYGSPEDVQSTPSMHEPPRPYDDSAGRGSIGRVIAIILSAGLAWATIVTLAAWILGRLLSRG